jgi:hypothetical protein
MIRKTRHVSSRIAPYSVIKNSTFSTPLFENNWHSVIYIVQYGPHVQTFPAIPTHLKEYFYPESTAIHPPLK